MALCSKTVPQLVQTTSPLAGSVSNSRDPQFVHLLLEDMMITAVAARNKRKRKLAMY